MGSFLSPPRFVRMPLVEAIACGDIVRIIDQDSDSGGEIQCLPLAYGADAQKIEHVFACILPEFIALPLPHLPGRLEPVGGSDSPYFWFHLDADDIVGVMSVTTPFGTAEAISCYDGELRAQYCVRMHREADFLTAEFSPLPGQIRTLKERRTDAPIVVEPIV